MRHYRVLRRAAWLPPFIRRFETVRVSVATPFQDVRRYFQPRFGTFCRCRRDRGLRLATPPTARTRPSSLVPIAGGTCLPTRQHLPTVAGPRTPPRLPPITPPHRFEHWARLPHRRDQRLLGTIWNLPGTSMFSVLASATPIRRFFCSAGPWLNSLAAFWAGGTGARPFYRGAEFTAVDVALGTVAEPGAPSRPIQASSPPPHTCLRFNGPFLLCRRHAVS